MAVRLIHFDQNGHINSKKINRTLNIFEHKTRKSKSFYETRLGKHFFNFATSVSGLCIIVSSEMGALDINVRNSSLSRYCLQGILNLWTPFNFVEFYHLKINSFLFEKCFCGVAVRTVGLGKDDDLSTLWRRSERSNDDILFVKILINTA